MNKGDNRIRVSPEFKEMLDKIVIHMKKYSYGILDVSTVDATKLLFLKMQKYGGIEKFLANYRLELE